MQELHGNIRIVFKQKKTGGLEYLDLNSQAADMLGERGMPDSYVFPNLGSIQSARISIAAWVRSAGINKHITFHCAVHTFAVMMLDLGVDLYTVSKLLGHKNIETTQVYAKVLDKNKQLAEFASLISFCFSVNQQLNIEPTPVSNHDDETLLSRTSGTRLATSKKPQA